MLPIQSVSPTKSTHRGDGSGGISVTRQMHEILDQPGYLSFAMGSRTLRDLYSSRSSTFDHLKLTYFGLCCYLGDYDKVVEEVESGHAPDLEGTETPYKFGYLTLVVFGAQDLQPNPQHIKVLKYLISCGAPADLSDITGNTALFHGTMATHLAKLDLCRVLLESGSDPNWRNRYGEVPLIMCFQGKGIGAIDLLMEFGADIYIADADGVTPRYFQTACAPEVTAVVQRWLRKRSGNERSMETKACKFCKKPGGDGVQLRLCSKCKTAWYCSTACQRSHWLTHKPLCQPFSVGNTVTLIPYYDPRVGILLPVAELCREIWSIPTPDTTQSHRHLGHAHTPKNLSAGSLKSIVIKVQVEIDLSSQRPILDGDILVYTKKRDFVCKIRRVDGPEEFDRISQVVRTKGVGGVKAYFAAELRGKTALIVKVSEVLAEQSF
ncbi:ankyrin repeat-containing domain protein [Armillaria mellea]|nr:ankyrin repeat-containing domain protein [Armillaria mellea]